MLNITPIFLILLSYLPETKTNQLDFTLKVCFTLQALQKQKRAKLIYIVE